VLSSVNSGIFAENIALLPLNPRILRRLDLLGNYPELYKVSVLVIWGSRFCPVMHIWCQIWYVFCINYTGFVIKFFTGIFSKLEMQTKKEHKNNQLAQCSMVRLEVCKKGGIIKKTLYCLYALKPGNC
jgi:hypothetical protein